VIGLSLRSGRKLVCQQAVELVTDYLEGALPWAQRRRFEAHLTSCVDCPEYLAQIRVVIALTGSITPADLSAQTRDELADLYLRWRADADQGALARAADPGRPSPRGGGDVPGSAGSATGAGLDG